MRSTSGQYWIALDQLRALAAFLVFCWHFLHAHEGYPVPFPGAPNVFPLALFDEGHVGVSLFMTLSGYLFVKLLHGQDIRYGSFLRNRLFRLAPLLIVTMILAALKTIRSTDQLREYLVSLGSGVILPTWPNGGWSITVELHFYLLLPFLLLLLHRRPGWLLAILAAAYTIRIGWYVSFGEVKSLAYFTLAGRIDQFLAGMLICRYRERLSGRHGLIATILIGFTVFYWAFDLAGGANGLEQSAIWIALPTIEAMCFAVLIAWYDTSFSPSDRGASGFVARLGRYSFAIYLLHFFFVFKMATVIDQHIMRLDNFYVALPWAMICFVAMMPVGFLSWHLIEQPFLKLRRGYLKPAPSQ